MPEGRRTRVLIIDDHENVRAALAATLERERDLVVTATGAAGNGDIEEALRFEPDVVLLEVKRGDGSGLDICRRIVQARPAARVLVLTSYPDTREQAAARALGAAYLFKDLDVHELMQRIRTPQARGVPEGPRGGTP